MTKYEHAYVDFASSTLHILAVQNGVNVETYGQSRDVFVAADRVEEVCAALREAAGLPPVWTVEKVAHDEAHGEKINASGGIDSTPVTYSLTPAGARGYAAQLLAAADEAEARAKRPKLPTAEDSVIKANGNVWVRGAVDWRRPGSIAVAGDAHMAHRDFTVLHDPEKAS